MEYKSPRGTRDILPPESQFWGKLVGILAERAEIFSYKKVYFPLFEHTELFSRGIGEDTDIVQKEMYTFQDKKGRWLTLRPEGTASVARLFVEHNMAHKGGIFKFYYIGSMYRYERPQAGRYREFYQIGVEALGSFSPYLDVEVISIGKDMMEAIGIKEYLILLNSIGCPDCRPIYMEVLKNYIGNKLENLCVDCQKRYDTNPLRILDCKKDRLIISDVPKSEDYLCPDCSEHYEKLKIGLSLLEIPWKEDPYLVRGLDYYTKTVFEIITSYLGENTSILGGGRYDDLVSLLGGPPTPGVGFALGLERLFEVAKEYNPDLFSETRDGVYIAFASNSVRDEGLMLSQFLRKNNIKVDIDYLERSLKAQAKTADKEGFRYLLTLFEKDMVLRDLLKGKDKVFSSGDITSLRLFLKGETI